MWVSEVHLAPCFVCGTSGMHVATLQLSRATIQFDRQVSVGKKEYMSSMFTLLPKTAKPKKIHTEGCYFVSADLGFPPCLISVTTQKKTRCQLS